MITNSMPRLYNKRIDKDIPEDAIYIGRGTPWGNPYVMKSERDRPYVCALFEVNVLPKLDLEPLRDKDLVCWCHPKQCHGDSIMKKLYGTHTIKAQFDILKRITTRGRSLFLEKEDNIGIDMFEHLETEIERLRVMLENDT